ncbi:MAG: hypothetical protein WAM96_19530 [Candidatus Acidiferrales bacterium]
MRFVSLFLLLLIASPAQTEQPQSSPDDRVSLDVGSITVWLGMSKTDVVKKFSNAGYEITDLSSGIIAHNSREFHDMRFKSGRLVFADLEWYSSNSEEIGAVVGALGALADKTKSRPCFLSHEPLSTPDTSLERIFIFCRERSVLIASGKVLGKPTVDVSERIGEIPADAQK